MPLRPPRLSELSEFMSKVIVLLVIGLKENLKEFVSVGKCGKFAQQRL